MLHITWSILWEHYYFVQTEWAISYCLTMDHIRWNSEIIKLVEQTIAKQVREMSRFLETDLDEGTIQKIAKHCTFDNLKNVKTFDLSVRIKAMNNCLPFRIMRVSHHSSIAYTVGYTV